MMTSTTSTVCIVDGKNFSSSNTARIRNSSPQTTLKEATPLQMSIVWITPSIHRCALSIVIITSLWRRVIVYSFPTIGSIKSTPSQIQNPLKMVAAEEDRILRLISGSTTCSTIAPSSVIFHRTKPLWINSASVKIIVIMKTKRKMEMEMMNVKNNESFCKLFFTCALFSY